MRHVLTLCCLTFTLLMTGCLTSGGTGQTSTTASGNPLNKVPGCDSNGDSVNKNPHCTDPVPAPNPSPHDPRIISAPAIRSLSFHWNFLFDSTNNLYSGTGTAANGMTTGLLKTSPGGQTTTFFSNQAVILLGKDTQDNIYVLTDAIGDFAMNGADAAAITIQKLSKSGTVSVVCGSPQCSSLEVIQGAAVGGGVVDSNGNLFVPLVFWAPPDGTTRWAWSEIAKITPTGGFSIFSGTTATSSGNSECLDGDSAHATYSGLTSMIIDKIDSIYVKDTGINGSVCNSIRKITPSGTVTTVHNFAGANVSEALTSDSDGNFYYYEYVNPSTGSVIKELSPSGTESTYCGGAAYSASTPGVCSTAYLQQIIGNLVFDASGNLYFTLNGAGSSPSAIYEIYSGP